MEGNSRCIPLLHTDKEVAHTEQRPRAHRARAIPCILNIAVPVDDTKVDASEGFCAFGLDDVDSAAAGCDESF